MGVGETAPATDSGSPWDAALMRRGTQAGSLWAIFGKTRHQRSGRQTVGAETHP